MRRPALLLALSLFAGGCLANKIQQEASTILRCPENRIAVVEREPKIYEAIGCGRSAICRSPNPDGSDLACAGGAPTR